MDTTHLSVIQRSVEHANIWVRDMAEELATEDRHEAYRALRAFLHVLRDRITVEETAQLAAQLPLLVRGIFYEGWRPSTTPRTYHDVATFLRRVAEEGGLAGETEASFAAAAGMRVLRRHVSAGELEDVLRILPAGIRALLSAPDAAA